MQWNELKQFYQGKSILITGHTGFKGTWLSVVLLELGAMVTGFALSPEEGSLFQRMELSERINHVTGDIRDQQALLQLIKRSKPEVIFHLAAQSLVSTGYQEPKRTIETNVMGTVNLLENCLLESSASIVVVTSDKCYQPRTTPCKEGDPLGGNEPYSASKAATEIIVEAYQKSFSSLQVATARGGNSIGAGDRASTRLFPDILRAYHQKRTLLLRCPASTRPWQFVLEPLWGYLILAVHLDQSKGCGAWNFAPFESIDVRQVVEYCQQLSDGRLSVEIQESTMQENAILLLCSEKSHQLLHWHCHLSWQEAFRWTWEDEQRLLVDLPYSILVDRVRKYAQRWA